MFGLEWIKPYFCAIIRHHKFNEITENQYTIHNTDKAAFGYAEGLKNIILERNLYF
jgi:hypothetical protein